MSTQLLVPLKSIASINKRVLGEGTDPEQLIRYIDISSVSQAGFNGLHQVFTFDAAPSRARRKIMSGSTIIATVRTYLKAVAFFDNPSQNEIVSTGFAVLDPCPGIDPRYLYYKVVSDDFVQKVEANSVGVSYPAINPSDLGKLKLSVLDSREEQAKIADFLDKKTATIDKMIAAKNHTRTHLAELRTAIITKAVLGQGSSNNLQQTNIPWIGEVPAHWTVRKLKDLATISIGWTPSTSNPEYFEGDNIWVTIADMNKKHISESKNRVSDVAIIDAGIKKVPKGSLLYSFKLSVGKVAFAGTDLYTNEAIAAIIPRNLKQIDNKFLYYALSTYLIDSANENIYGAKLLNQSLIKNAYIALPPIDEQKQIATELNRKLTKLDRTMVKTTNSLELLKEYRSSLISNVITGKVAV